MSMTVEEVKKHKAWEYLNLLTPKERYFSFTGKGAKEIREGFGCRIEERPYTALDKIADNELALAMHNTDLNVFSLGVLILTKTENHHA